MARWTNPVPHEPHHRAGARTDVEAAHARAEPGAIEQRLRRTLPHRGLVAQALIFLGIAGMNVAVGIAGFCHLSSLKEGALATRGAFWGGR